MAETALKSIIADAGVYLALDTPGPPEDPTWVIDAEASVVADTGEPTGVSKWLHVQGFFDPGQIPRGIAIQRMILYIERAETTELMTGDDLHLELIRGGVGLGYIAANRNWPTSRTREMWDLVDDFGVDPRDLPTPDELEDGTFGYRLRISWSTGSETFQIYLSQLKLIYRDDGLVRPWGGVYQYNPCEPCCQPTYQFYLGQEPADRQRRCGNCNSVPSVMLLQQSQATADQLVTEPRDPEGATELIMQRASYIRDEEYCSWCSRRLTVHQLTISAWRLSYNQFLKNQWTLDVLRYNIVDPNLPRNRLVFRFKLAPFGTPFDCLAVNTFEFFEETGDGPKGIWGDDITVEPYWD